MLHCNALSLMQLTSGFCKYFGFGAPHLIGLHLVHEMFSVSHKDFTFRDHSTVCLRTVKYRLRQPRPKLLPSCLNARGRASAVWSSVQWWHCCVQIKIVRMKNIISNFMSNYYWLRLKNDFDLVQSSEISRNKCHRAPSVKSSGPWWST